MSKQSSMLSSGVCMYDCGDDISEEEDSLEVQAAKGHDLIWDHDAGLGHHFVQLGHGEACHNQVCLYPTKVGHAILLASS